jgi:hypothetical protein
MTHWHKVRCRSRFFSSCAVYVVSPNYESCEFALMFNTGPAFLEWSR